MGESSEALVSWFFSLAHELAHNAVAEHNSEHEVSFRRKKPGRRFTDGSLAVLFQQYLRDFHDGVGKAAEQRLAIECSTGRAMIVMFFHIVIAYSRFDNPLALRGNIMLESKTNDRLAFRGVSKIHI